MFNKVREWVKAHEEEIFFGSAIAILVLMEYGLVSYSWDKGFAQGKACFSNMCDDAIIEEVKAGRMVLRLPDATGSMVETTDYPAWCKAVCDILDKTSDAAIA